MSNCNLLTTGISSHMKLLLFLLRLIAVLENPATSSVETEEGQGELALGNKVLVIVGLLRVLPQSLKK